MIETKFRRRKDYNRILKTCSYAYLADFPQNIKGLHSFISFFFFFGILLFLKKFFLLQNNYNNLR